MGKLLIHLLGKGAPQEPQAAPLDRNHKAKVICAALGMLCIGAIAVAASADTWNAAYRVIWLLATATVLWLGSKTFKLFETQNIRQIIMAFVMLIIQMLFIWMIFSVYNLAIENVQHINLQHRQMLLLLPYMLAPVTVTVLAGIGLGMYTAFACAFFGVAIFPINCPPEVVMHYFIISLLAGVVSTRYARYEKRVEPLIGGLITGAIVFASAVAFNAFRSEGQTLSMAGLVMALGVTMGVNLLTVIVFAGAVPILENISSLFTPMTWRERAVSNHPLLMRLKQEAPGTYAHCQEVKILAESAAVALDADDDLVAACALFHDIGKLSKPGYFTENIVDQSQTPHSELTPEASARIILSHVEEGVKLAQEYGLESRIIDVIREHHGKSTVYFFYRKALDQYEAAMEKFENNLTDTRPAPVDAGNFTYKGQVPQSRESAIVSMADAVESATRSLNHATVDDYRNMIENIFRARVLDGHLKDSGLTLGELEKMKEAFLAAICASHHSRIQYPKPKE